MTVYPNYPTPDDILRITLPPHLATMISQGYYSNIFLLEKKRSLHPGYWVNIQKDNTYNWGTNIMILRSQAVQFSQMRQREQKIILVKSPQSDEDSIIHQYLDADKLASLRPETQITKIIYSLMGQYQL